MTTQGTNLEQSLFADELSYFFLRVRKSHIRKIVERINTRFPNETAEQKARKLMAAQVPLSFLGGAIMHLPTLLPGIGGTLTLLGVVGGASVVTRMHLYLILEIALLYGKDIDDEERIPEMMAIVAATCLSAGAPLLADAMNINPLLSIPAAGLTASAIAQLIGEGAIRFYSPAGEALPLDAAVAESPA